MGMKTHGYDAEYRFFSKDVDFPSLGDDEETRRHEAPPFEKLLRFNFSTLNFLRYLSSKYIRPDVTGKWNTVDKTYVESISWTHANDRNPHIIVTEIERGIIPPDQMEKMAPDPAYALYRLHDLEKKAEKRGPRLITGLVLNMVSVKDSTEDFSKLNEIIINGFYDRLWQVQLTKLLEQNRLGKLY